MEDIQHLGLHYGAAMAHQEIFQQQIIINQLIKGRGRWLGWGKRSQNMLHIKKASLASMIRSRLGSEKKILKPFKNSNCP